jgi:hypothetical protein
MGAGDVVNYNLGIIAIMEGDYDAATNYLGSTNTVNSALVKLLKDDYDAALATINKVEKESAKKHYVKAVVLANQDKDSEALQALGMAVSKDADLKAHAKKDMEFAKYFENDEFKSMVE